MEDLSINKKRGKKTEKCSMFRRLFSSLILKTVIQEIKWKRKKRIVNRASDLIQMYRKIRTIHLRTPSRSLSFDPQNFSYVTKLTTHSILELKSSRNS